MDVDMLTDKMRDAGYKRMLNKSYELPNGKALVRLDFQTGLL